MFYTILSSQLSLVIGNTDKILKDNKMKTTTNCITILYVLCRPEALLN